MKILVYLAALFLITEFGSGISIAAAQKRASVGPTIPKTWDDKAIADLEIPLANPIGSPKHVSADYYYRIPVRPIYKTYPVYLPGHEPSGYMGWLKQQRPVVIWDDEGHNPSLHTDKEWISAGERVFEAPTDFFPPDDGDIKTVLSALERYHVPPTRDGVLPFFRYVVREKGKVEVGFLGCATCHSRIMPDGSVLKGAQGSFPDIALGFPVENAREFQRMLFATPWISPDPLAPIDHMGADELTAVKAAIPIGVIGRHRTSIFYPVQVPDLIGVRDRRYLDRTGLQQHRSIVDMMRYAALNQGADDLANFDGFILADFPRFKTLPGPEKESRYSDEQLYALALYVYSLEPPPNPNKFDMLAQRGQERSTVLTSVPCRSSLASTAWICPPRTNKEVLGLTTPRPVSIKVA